MIGTVASAGQPKLLFRPRLVNCGSGLALEIGRADLIPMKPGATEPFVLYMEPGWKTIVPLPYKFTVEWVNGPQTTATKRP